MNKKLITGALIAIAAGVATYFYRRRKNRLNAIAADTYDTMDDTFTRIEDRTESFF